MVRAYGELPILLTSLQIAPYTYGTDTIGTASTLDDQMTIEIDWEFDTDEMKSGGKWVHGLSVPVGATFTISAGGVPWNALVTLAGWTLNSPSAGVETLRGDVGPAGKLPYFATAGKFPDVYTGDLHCGVVACLLDKPPVWSRGENSEFFVSEMSGRIIVPSGRKLPYFEKHQTAAAINMATLFA